MLMNPIYLIIYPQLKEDRWIHALPKGISMKWNANNLDYDLNLGHDSISFWW